MYIPSQFLIDEHNMRLKEAAGRSDRQPRSDLATVRRRVSGALRGVADRLDPAGAHGVKCVVVMYPGDAQTIAARMEVRR